MDVRTCLRNFWLSKGDNAIAILKMKGQEIQHYVNNGITNNPFKFFQIATILDKNGYEVDNFSKLPSSNREAISALLDKKLTVDDYMKEMDISRDSFMRYLKMAPGAASGAPELIAAANRKLIAQEQEPDKANESQTTPILDCFEQGGESEESEESVSQKHPLDIIPPDHDLILNLIIAMAANATVLNRSLDDYLNRSSVEDRVALRDVLSRAGFPLFQTSNMSHHLTNKLNALCSEKSLQSYLIKK